MSRRCRCDGGLSRQARRPRSATPIRPQARALESRPRQSSRTANFTAFGLQRTEWWVQPVSATSLICDVLKGPMMARTGRPGLSPEQKTELWQRWKAGETLSDIGRALGGHWASPRPRCSALSQQRVVLRRCPGHAIRARSVCWSERRSRAVSLKAAPSASLAEIWDGRCPRSAVKLPVMAGAGPVEPPGLRNVRRTAPAVPSPASWHSTRPCANWLPQSCRGNGRHSRSPGG